MAWKDVSVMSQRSEFVVLASTEGANVSELCRRFGVSRKTGYKWLARFSSQGCARLADRSRRPKEPAGRNSGEGGQRGVALRREPSSRGGQRLPPRRIGC